MQKTDKLPANAGSIATVGELFRACATGCMRDRWRWKSRPPRQLWPRCSTGSSARPPCSRRSGLQRGDRVALLSRNRPEYFEIELAAANLGVITACLNWRLSPRELTYCVELVSPRLLVVEPDLAE